MRSAKNNTGHTQQNDDLSMRFDMYGKRLACVTMLCVLVGCGSDSSDGTQNNNSANNANNGKGDFASSWAEEFLSGREDPIAKFFQQEDIDDSGVLQVKLRDLQLGVAEIQGCDVASVQSYIISDALIQDRPFPRLVSTVCSKDPEKNWQVFFSPPEAAESGDDLNIHTVEMFAWDPEAKHYRFYKTKLVAERDNLVQLEVDPAECADCHLGPEGLDNFAQPMLPIMNELTQPWQHWNASPGFDSQEFDLPADIESAPNYEEYAGNTWKGSASVLEQIIKAGHEQVGQERVAIRRLPRSGSGETASVKQTMAMLRPLFCEEQVNYISEPGTSGQLTINAAVDTSMAEILKEFRPDNWGQKWMSLESRIRMDSPTGDDKAITMMPVRGNAGVVYERMLITFARGIDKNHALQIRALDWQNPVFSELRCDLWAQTNDRLQREQLDVDLASMRNYQLIPILVEEIMKVGDTSLLPPEGTFYMLDSADNLNGLLAAIDGESVPAAECESGECTCAEGFCAVDIDTFADVVETYVVGLENDPDVRSIMWDKRQRDVCIAAACYNNQPFLTDVEECECPIGGASSIQE